MSPSARRKGTSDAEYRIVEPAPPEAPARKAVLATLTETPAGLDVERISLRVKSEAPGAEEGLAEGGTVAVLVAHGMGQQVPYQTLDDVAQGLADAEERATGTRPTLQASQARVGDKDLRFVEMPVNGRTVHVFEAYWAPVTEDKVTLRDVMSFMLAAGSNGAWRGLFGWRRALFGREFPSSRLHSRLAAVGASVMLLVALVGILALVAMNALIVAMAGDAALPGSLPLEALRPAFSQLFLGFAVPAGLFALLLAAAMAIKGPLRKARSAGWARVLRALSKTANALALAAAVLTFLALYAMLAGIVFAFQPGWADAPWLWPFARGHAGLMAAGAPLAGWRGGALVLVLWPALVAASWFARRVLVQFPGDVVAYVSPHKLDRFAEVRDEVKKRVKDVAHAIYARPGPPGTRRMYGRVLVVGHSLGSVAAYDALNALLNDDALAEKGKGLDVADRTKLLLTFGSPLDKTAFVFATNQGAGGTRESLTLLSQPLVRDYAAFRRFPWVNVHSPWDVISGPLTFYDDPDKRDAARAPPVKGSPAAPAVDLVENVADPDADVPLAAHVEYWRNRVVWDRLRRHV